jgi:glucosamine--fructose-6-phosphate aminotransferase (isomerizing)
MMRKTMRKLILLIALLLPSLAFSAPLPNLKVTSEMVYQKLVEIEKKQAVFEAIAVTNPECREVQEKADAFIEVPEVNEFLSPIVNIIPLQLLAYYIADFLGYDVDQPRNLAKSVTVE